MAELPSLQQAGWLQVAALQHLLRVIAAAGGEARVAGGAIRNALMGEPVTEIDVACTLLPEVTTRVCEAAGFSVHPTGLSHGTVTVVSAGVPYEVTTLRRDEETDGRHARVAFTADWAEDASRRDFTINAMYCSAEGKIYDYTNGYTDILASRVRFVGEPRQRIAEDYLRILRFFRFYARYGKGAPDAAGLAACTALKAGLASLSAERVAQEMLKLLVAPGAVPTLRIMAQYGILDHIIPYTDDFSVIARLPEDAILRLVVLAQQPLELQGRFKLSNAQHNRIENMLAAPPLSPALSEQERRKLLYKLGEQAWVDAVLLAWARSAAPLSDVAWQNLLDVPQQWQAPPFPVAAADLLRLGMVAGPALGLALKRIRAQWINSDFSASRDMLLTWWKEQA